jgi:hypothetical protein
MDILYTMDLVVQLQISWYGFHFFSVYVWQLKRRGIEFSIKWQILKQVKFYSPASNRCNLCLWEKYFITCMQTWIGYFEQT